ncbi:unnamed protein product [Prorocentrum cordatum]|uniref:RNase H type-1 domain-containing protein n=1 Tax=Prorocentrum cordatum TaxID=2364126 RepID=A0ABN9SIA0_9DINO|nr:unnamed protein product [Polarella glacialis]
MSNDSQNACFWLRGIPPASWCSAPPPPQWDSGEQQCFAVDCAAPVWEEHGGAIEASRFSCSEIYLDGSTTSIDALVARAGWGVALMMAHDVVADADLPGWFGTVDCAQTVPNAELAAVVWALRGIRGDAAMYTDSQVVYDDWHAGQVQRPSGQFSRWWRRVKVVLEHRPGGGTLS